VISRQSHSIRLKVGCIIVEREKLGNIISFGWNGMPSGEINACEVDDEGNIITEEEFLLRGRMRKSDLKSREGVIHAERNALLKIDDFSIYNDAVLYVTHEPCTHCAEEIVESGFIGKVVFRYSYSPDINSSSYGKPSGTNYLESKGI